MAEKVEEEEEEEEVKEEVEKGEEQGQIQRRSGLADGQKGEEGRQCARESERSIRTLATFFVVGTGNSRRKRERERDRDTGSTCVRT